MIWKNVFRYHGNKLYNMMYLDVIRDTHTQCAANMKHLMCRYSPGRRNKPLDSFIYKIITSILIEHEDLTSNSLRYSQFGLAGWHTSFDLKTNLLSKLSFLFYRKSRHELYCLLDRFYVIINIQESTPGSSSIRRSFDGRHFIGRYWWCYRSDEITRSETATKH